MDQNLYRWVSSLLQPDLPISTEILEPSDPVSWFSWKSCGGFELSGKVQEMGMPTPKGAKIISQSVQFWTCDLVVSSDLSSPPTALPPFSYSVNGSAVHHWLRSQTWGSSGSCPFPSPPPSCHVQPAPYVLPGPVFLLQPHEFHLCSDHHLSSSLTTGS